MTRRAFLLLILSWLAVVPPVATAWASDDDDDSGGSNSGSGSGNSGSGSSGSGSGSSGDDDDDDSGGSGSGSGSSGSGSDDDNDDDDDDDDSGGNSGSGSSGSGKKSEQDRALTAVSAGRALPLEEALKRLRKRYPGRVIDVDLRREGKRLVYRFKVKSDAGLVRKVTMDATTGEIRGFFGF